MTDTADSQDGWGTGQEGQSGKEGAREKERDGDKWKDEK